MKKILILAGASSTGKTSVSANLYKKRNFNVLKIDAIINAINCVSSEKINKDELQSDDVKNILESLIKNVWVDTNYRDYRYVIETCSLLPEKAKQLQDKFNSISVIYLVDTSTKENLINKILKNQKKYDWTSNLSNSELDSVCLNLNNSSRKFIEDCKQCNLNYIDVKDLSIDEIEKNILNILEAQ